MIVDLFKMLLSAIGKERDVIVDEAPLSDGEKRSHATFQNVKRMANELENEFMLIGRVNCLLEAPVVEVNKDKHLALTLRSKQWLNNGKRLTIVFSLETTEPICAYFKEEDE